MSDAVDYDTLYLLWEASNLSYREFWEQVVQSRGISFEAFRSAMRRQTQKKEQSKEVSPSARQIQDHLQRADAAVRTHIENTMNTGGLTGVFMSDIHLPYVHWPAFHLALKVIEYLNPDYITGLNDVFDFEEYSRWPNLKSPAQRLWSGDIENPLQLHGRIMASIRDAAPQAVIEGIVGNHDVRMYRYLRSQFPSGADWAMLQFVERLQNQGLSVTAIEKENTREIGELVLLHGTHATINPYTTAYKTIRSQIRRPYMDNSGQLRPVIYGHDHRSYTIPYNSAYAYSSGCLCRMDMEYLKYPPDWQWGVTYFRVEKDGRAQAYPITFLHKNGYLTARLFETELKERNK